MLVEERRDESCANPAPTADQAERLFADIARQFIRETVQEKRSSQELWSPRDDRNIWSKRARLRWCHPAERIERSRGFRLRRLHRISFVEREFSRLCEEWKRDTMHWSSMTRMLSHRSYLGIIGLAARADRHEVERLLLEELQREPDHWFDALSAITGEDPVKPEHDFDQAVNAWLEWGRQRRII